MTPTTEPWTPGSLPPEPEYPLPHHISTDPPPNVPQGRCLFSNGLWTDEFTFQPCTPNYVPDLPAVPQTTVAVVGTTAQILPETGPQEQMLTALGFFGACLIFAGLCIVRSARRR